MSAKKVILLGIGLLFVTGCGSKKDELLGKWTTKYEMGMYGEVTQIYEFNKDKTCKRIIVTDMKIEKECTYEKTENTIEIKYNDGDADTVNYRFEEKGAVIDGFTYTKSK